MPAGGLLAQAHHRRGKRRRSPHHSGGRCRDGQQQFSLAARFAPRGGGRVPRRGDTRPTGNLLVRRGRTVGRPVPSYAVATGRPSASSQRAGVPRLGHDRAACTSPAGWAVGTLTQRFCGVARPTLPRPSHRVVAWCGVVWRSVAMGRTAAAAAIHRLPLTTLAAVRIIFGCAGGAANYAIPLHAAELPVLPVAHPGVTLRGRGRCFSCALALTPVWRGTPCAASSTAPPSWQFSVSAAPFRELALIFHSSILQSTSCHTGQLWKTRLVPHKAPAIGRLWTDAVAPRSCNRPEVCSTIIQRKGHDAFSLAPARHLVKSCTIARSPVRRITLGQGSAPPLFMSQDHLQCRWPTKGSSCYLGITSDLRA